MPLYVNFSLSDHNGRWRGSNVRDTFQNESQVGWAFMDNTFAVTFDRKEINSEFLNLMLLAHSKKWQDLQAAADVMRFPKGGKKEHGVPVDSLRWKKVRITHYKVEKESYTFMFQAMARVL